MAGAHSGTKVHHLLQTFMTLVFVGNERDLRWLHPLIFMTFVFVGHKQVLDFLSVK